MCTRVIKQFFFLVCLAVTIINISYGQGIYEVKYTFTQEVDAQQITTEYHAILFYYGEEFSENNKMRVRYYNSVSGEWNVVEMKVSVKETQLEGTDYYVLQGSDPVVIDGPNGYNPDYIVLSKSPGEQYYSPDFVLSENEEGIFRGELTRFRVLNQEDVNNNFLAQFKWEWNTNISTLQGSTLHLILVTNSNDAPSGRGFETNATRVKAIFKDMAEVVEMPVNIIEISGTDFSKDNINYIIDNLSPTQNDVIVFYYSGHGFRFANDTEDWPRLDLRQGMGQALSGSNSMNLEDDVFMPLRNKNCRLLITIGECCNVNNNLTPMMTDPVMIAPGGNMYQPAKVKRLLGARGHILIATCSKK